MTEMILKEEERIAFSLRSLYKKYGYLPYKMSKFEEYDLYVANKEFLMGEGMITFNDTDGKLLALKPDVTLSIIKNSVDGEAKRKVYYHENVYRISGNTKQFKEIPQAGVECIGEIGAYDVFESVYLAAMSLSTISENFVLDISHLGIVFAVLSEIHAGEVFDKAVMRCLAEKNAPALAKLCQEEEISTENTEKLQILLSAYGKMDEVLCKIKPVCLCGKAKLAYETLQELCSLLSATEFADKYRLDFSVVNDMAYYDDVVFKGFIDGIADGVLSGGRYDKLMRRMSKRSGAIGFAVNMDALEGFKAQAKTQDVDVLVLYDDKNSAAEIAATVKEWIAQGKSVRAQKKTGNVRFEKLVDITGGGV